MSWLASTFRRPRSVAEFVRIPPSSAHAPARHLALPAVRRRGFTLVELMVVMVVIAILASVVLGALARATGTAKAQRSRSIVSKLNTQVMLRWESYRTRRLPIDAATHLSLLPTVQADVSTLAGYRGLGGSDPLLRPNSAGTWPDIQNSMQLAAVRLLAIRELMRLELPSRFEDVTSTTLTGTWPTTLAPVTPRILANSPALSQAYLRRMQSVDPTLYPTGPTSQYQGAECLYMIVTMGGEDISLQTDHVHPSDIGDKDNDGMSEFLDGFGNPISFIRWAPGFISDLQPEPLLPNVNVFSKANHDPFDPLSLDLPPPPPATANPRGFRLTPLIYSAGPDESLDVWPYSAGMSPAESNDPYHLPAAGMYAGTPMTTSTVNPGNGEAADNIHNHFLGRR